MAIADRDPFIEWLTRSYDKTHPIPYTRVLSDFEGSVDTRERSVNSLPCTDLETDTMCEELCVADFEGWFCDYMTTVMTEDIGLEHLLRSAYEAGYEVGYDDRAAENVTTADTLGE